MGRTFYSLPKLDINELNTILTQISIRLDTIQGNISVVNDIVTAGMLRQGTVWHAYGGFEDQAETISITTKDEWTFITNATNTLWTGSEADGLSLSGDVMTIANSGDYYGTLSITLSGLNGKDFQIRCYNITQARAMGGWIGATTTGAGNYTNVTLPLYLECNANDKLRMEIRCTTDASDPTLRSAVFYISYLHD